MISKEQVEQIALEWLESRDYFLVDVVIGHEGCIKVEIDHQDGVWIDDCAALSRFIEERLSSLSEDYELEVGSAGLGQPFKVLKQYECHIGQTIEVLSSLDGKKYEGVLKEVTPEYFVLTMERKMRLEGQKRPKMVEEDLRFQYGDIKYAKYVISFK